MQDCCSFTGLLVVPADRFQTTLFIMHYEHAYSIPEGRVCSELLVSGLDLAAARSAATASRFRATCRSICCSAASARCWQCFCNACTCRQYNVAMQAELAARYDDFRLRTTANGCLQAYKVQFP